MNHHSPLDGRSLATRITSGFFVLVSLTGVAAGLLAGWLFSAQLERQAWAQLAQGAGATQALYTAHAEALASWASLVAERPTLAELVAAGERAPLSGRWFLQEGDPLSH